MSLSVRGELFAGFGLAFVAPVLVSALALTRLGALNTESGEVGGVLDSTGAVVQLVRGGEEIHRTAFVGALALVARGQTADATQNKHLADQAEEHLGELKARIPESTPPWPRPVPPMPGSKSSSRGSRPIGRR